MELLAPAGTRENFLVAIEAGADAVYLGAPRLNARNLARDLGLDEIAALIAFAHERRRKVYIAINSLVRESDLSLVLETLAELESIGPDALIVQDLGMIQLVRRFFPALRLHASTLMSTHNREGIELLARLGCARAVLARELTLEELATLARDSSIELEVFIHGAMCFSYSGLCLFSSYFGGQSGLRGNCVQPCRRKYSVIGGKGRSGSATGRGGYFFSMNDLEGLAQVPELKRIGVDSLKIEGRLRSATYVSRVVAAYRLVIDASEESAETAIAQAARLIPEAMGRATSTGFFLSPRPRDAIIPHRSGNIGTYLGRIDNRHATGNRTWGQLTLKEQCAVGDRLRLHSDRSGERIGFTLAQVMAGPTPVQRAEAGQRVELLLPPAAGSAKDAERLDVYRVDGQEKTGHLLRDAEQQVRPVVTSATRKKQLAMRIARLRPQIVIGDDRAEGQSAGGTRGRGRAGRKPKSEMWLRTDTPHLLLSRLPFHPDRWVVNLRRQSLSFSGRLKGMHKGAVRDIIWALPPIIPAAAMNALQRDIRVLLRSGYRNFQIAQLGQIELFAGEKVNLFGDYTLNLLNSQALELVFRFGLQGAQLAIEADRACLTRAVSGWRQRPSADQHAKRAPGLLGLTVYGAPPLFTARLAADHFVYGRPLASPKQELFTIEKQDGVTLTRPQRPFSLLPFRGELEQIGLDYLVVDLSGMRVGKKDLQELGRRIHGTDKVPTLPTFNYRGTLA
jgi:U32 family peptidase